MKDEPSQDKSSDKFKADDTERSSDKIDDRREQAQSGRLTNSNSGRTRSGREQIEDLLRTLNIVSPGRPTVTSLPGASVEPTSPAGTSNPKSTPKVNVEQKSHLHAKLANSHPKLSGESPAFKPRNMKPSPEGKTESFAPLPIGTEKKLGLLEKLHQPYGSPSGSFSPDRWGVDIGSWYRTTGHAIPISPPPVTQVFSIHRTIRSSAASGDHRTIDSGSPGSIAAGSNSGARRHNSRDSEPRSIRAFGQESHHPRQRHPTTSTTSSEVASEGGRSHARPSFDSEEYEFADSITTPAYGTYFEPHGRVRRTSNDSPYPYPSGSNGSPNYPTTRAAQQVRDNNIATQGRRRSSVPSSSLRQAAPLSHGSTSVRSGRSTTFDPVILAPSLSVSHAHAYHNNRVDMSPQTAPVVDFNTPPRAYQGRGNSPTHRFSDPGPERDLGYQNWHGENGQLVPVAYNDSGLLPSYWPAPNFAPPDQSAMAPGDWLCEQTHCGYHNFQRNADCRACGHPRTFEHAVSSAPSDNGANNQPPPPAIQHGNGNPPLGSVGDWRCECGYINWRRRALCKNCYPNHPTNQDRGHLSLSPLYSTSAPLALNDLQTASVARILDEANGNAHVRAIGSAPASYTSAVNITTPTYTRQAQELAHASFADGSHPESSRHAQQRYNSARSAHERTEWDGIYRG